MSEFVNTQPQGFQASCRYASPKRFLRSSIADGQIASSRAEALAVISNTANDARPDILVCDITMPIVDGYTGLRRMRALKEARGVAGSQRIPAIALTALAGAANYYRCSAATVSL